MALPSIADALVIVVLLVPGFVAFFLIRRISAVSRNFSDLEMTVWSVFLSLVGYVPFSLITGLNNLDSITNGIFLPWNFLILIGCTLSSGVITGVILKRFFRKGMTAGTAWDHSFGGVSKDEQEGGYFMVYTNDGLEYKGELHMAGAEHERRDVVMRNPKLILRDKGWNVKDEIEVGKEILFVEGDIRRIVFFDEL